jgi:hypothetical protein
MKPSTGAAVRLHRNAVRDRPESLSAFKWNACPPSPEPTLALEDVPFRLGILHGRLTEEAAKNVAFAGRLECSPGQKLLIVGASLSGSYALLGTKSCP